MPADDRAAEDRATDDRTGSTQPARRRFLARSTLALGAAAAAQLPFAGKVSAAGPVLPTGLFTLGVASGDPLPDAVVLWTRLAPDPLNGGGMPAVPVAVEWQVADDRLFRRIVRHGTAQAVPELGHSVHADATGLLPGRQYWYRFRCGGQIYPVGRTCTAPDPRTTGRSSASPWPPVRTGSMASSPPTPTCAPRTLDLVLFVGDYIYESTPVARRVRRARGDAASRTLWSSTATGTRSTAPTPTCRPCTRMRRGW